LNPETVVFMRSLSNPAGLEHCGVHFIRVPPKRESFPHHCHYGEEEWVYVISGRGVLDMGEETREIAPGDFMGFARGPVAHQIRNPNDVDLVYLTGGERSKNDVADFTKLKKRMVRIGGEARVADL